MDDRAAGETSEVADRAALAELVRPVMEAHWREPGFTVPNAATYPWQWLWDSCFCALIWADLGEPDRGVQELRAAVAHQGPTGFVPHVTYWSDPERLRSFWGRSRTSCITQPPMLGHAVAELARRGVSVPADVVEAAVRAVWFLLRDRRRSPGGLVEIVHPWESGADDSPRWDSLLDVGVERTDLAWYERKGELVRSIRFDEAGAPVANDGGAVGSVAFSALVAWNALELVRLTGDDALAAAAESLATALTARWDGNLGTWVDDGLTATGSGRLRTLEALLPALVDPDREHVDIALHALVDPSAHGAPYGPTGVHRAEPCFAPATYWRGPAWPQLTYLMWCAAHGAERTDVANAMARSLTGGAVRSGLAEYWHPDTAAPGGAVPQSWTGLALVVA